MPLKPKSWMNMTPETESRIEKRPFLRKGSGLKRFYPHLTTHTATASVPNESKENDTELELFEIMEQMTTCQSFCSTSSVVVRFVNTEINLDTVPENYTPPDSGGGDTNILNGDAETTNVNVNNEFDITTVPDHFPASETSGTETILSDEDEELNYSNVNDANVITVPEPFSPPGTGWTDKHLYDMLKEIRCGNGTVNSVRGNESRSRIKYFTPPGTGGSEKAVRNRNKGVTFADGPVKSLSDDELWSRVNYFTPPERSGTKKISSNRDTSNFFIHNRDEEITCAKVTLKSVSDDGVRLKNKYFSGENVENNARLKHCPAVTPVPGPFTPPGKGGREKVLPNGDREITYRNGTVKSVSSDGVWTRVKYFNGDIREAKSDGWFKYVYADGTGELIHYSDETCEFKYSNGQVHTLHPDGTQETIYPNGYRRKQYLDQKEEYNFNGEGTLIVETNGNSTLILPNGQKEVHTDSFRKRIYPDRTERTVYKDGSQETVYTDGRLIMKDALGHILYNGYRWNNEK